MIGVNVLERILRRVQLSVAVAGARPLNIIIIGPSGGGKSSVLMQSKAVNSETLMDFTSESLVRFCEREKPRYIICPDLNIVVSHKPSVANLTMAALLAITGEGTSKIPGFEGQVKFSLPEGFVCGLMTACTYDIYVSKRGKWRQVGLLRRLLPIYFSYLPATVCNINQSIAKGMVPSYAPNGRWSVPDGRHAIKLSEAYATRLNDLAGMTMAQMSWIYKTRKGERRTERAYDYSFDLHLMFRTYAKACSLERKDTEVRESDVLETEILSRFVRLDRPYEI
jgi:hypothetical protein